MSVQRSVLRRTALVGFLVGLALVVAGCGSSGLGAAENKVGPMAAGFATLPNRPQVLRSVIIVDVGRLRRAYRRTSGFRRALQGVWLPDAAVGVVSPAWRRSLGFGLDDLESVASAGYHPSSVMVAAGTFSPERVRSALEGSGCRAKGDRIACHRDGAFDARTPTGRLVLSAVNQVRPSRTRLITASTAALERAAEAPGRTLADDEGFAALAAALDPVTSAVVLDAHLVRPPTGVPAAILPRFAARRIAAGIDDRGSGQRTLKLGLLYDRADEAESDAATIRSRIASTRLSGAVGDRFSDVAAGWKVIAEGRVVKITATLPSGADPGTWRYLVESGDLATLVRQRP